MSDHYFNFNGGHGIISLANIYECKNFTFEFHAYCGPVKLRKKDWTESKRTGRVFYKMLDGFLKLSKKRREKYRIYG